MIEALPTPFGLIRSGVAPDHQDVKSCQVDFTNVAESPRFSFHGNVTVGSEQDEQADISVAQLRQRYNAVVFCTGATSDRLLNIPGEELEGVHSARAVVNWYNSHPEYIQYPLDLSAPRSGTCVIVGQGNVAVDCARILSCDPSILAESDIADYSIDALKKSGIKKVIVMGRRGHVQASFTMKELRELTKLKGATFVVQKEELDASMTTATEEEIKTLRVPKRMNKLLRKVAGRTMDEDKDETELCLTFLKSPIEIIPHENNPAVVGGVRVAINALEGSVGQQQAQETGKYETIPCDLVLRSVGYLGVPLDGVAFDDRKCIIANTRESAGRVVHASNGESVAGMFTAGWAKRGPTGIVGTNIPCAKETVASILKDAETGALPSIEVEGGVMAGVEGEGERGGDTVVVEWEEYLNIDQYEVEQGAVKGKVRDKMLLREDMFKVAKAKGQH
jgi:adrenodoxin-NADP+ reductase